MQAASRDIAGLILGSQGARASLGSDLQSGPKAAMEALAKRVVRRGQLAP